MCSCLTEQWKTETCLETIIIFTTPFGEQKKHLPNWNDSIQAPLYSLFWSLRRSLMRDIPEIAPWEWALILFNIFGSWDFDDATWVCFDTGCQKDTVTDGWGACRAVIDVRIGLKSRELWLTERETCLLLYLCFCTLIWALFWLCVKSQFDVGLKVLCVFFIRLIHLGHIFYNDSWEVG